jgi:hypothetical protein
MQRRADRTCSIFDFSQVRPLSYAPEMNVVLRLKLVNRALGRTSSTAPAAANTMATRTASAVS